MSPLSLSNSRAEAALTVEWSDGVVQRLANRLLRARCRCTECESARRAGTPIKAGAGTGVVVEQINLIGSYGVQLVFSDGHERGIYPWAYLRSLDAEEVVQS